MDKPKIVATAALSALTAFANKYAAIVVFVVIVVCMDIVTGIIASCATGEKISSEKGTKGFWKKMALFAALAFGFLLDYFIPYMVSYTGIELPASALFGVMIGCYIVINESISICENLYRCNDEILPKWVVNLLTQSKDKIDKVE